MKPTPKPPPLNDLSKIIKLSRGLLMSMRLLKSRNSGDTSTGELLAMQRFFREFEGWIKELDQQRNEQLSLRATLRRRHQKLDEKRVRVHAGAHPN